MVISRPRISMVTPSYNQAAWVERTLFSVLNQPANGIEYIVVDGNSTDGTIDILETYRSRLNHLIIGPDSGMYEAINKGFARSSGDIMGWINSDDMLHPNALTTVLRIFDDLPEVEWITGCRSVFDEQDCCVATEPAPSWSQAKVMAGDYQWIQQESTFWRRGLYERAGGFVETKYKLAGDFDLWNRFFGHAELYSTDALLGGFRVRQANQASLEGLAAYEQEVAAILHATPKTPALSEAIVAYKLSRETGLVNRIQRRIKGGNPETPFPARIYFDRQAQRFKLRA